MHAVYIYTIYICVCVFTHIAVAASTQGLIRGQKMETSFFVVVAGSLLSASYVVAVVVDLWFVFPICWQSKHFLQSPEEFSQEVSGVQGSSVVEDGLPVRGRDRKGSRQGHQDAEAAQHHNIDWGPCK